MPRIGIVSALHDELAAVLQRLPDEQRESVAGRDFWRGHWHGHELVAVLARVGKVAAATTATLLVERFGVDRIVFTGVAGGLATGVKVGDIVVARELLQHDMDASPLFARYEVPLTGRARFPADAALADRLAVATEACLRALPREVGAAQLAAFGIERARLHQGLVISGDRFVSSAAESAALRDALPDALAVEMEGAAVAQVCADFGVPLAVVRVVSDRADDSAHVDFLRFTAEVASVLTRLVVVAALAQA